MRCAGPGGAATGAGWETGAAGWPLVARATIWWAASKFTLAPKASETKRSGT